jgi:hypothetical protein
MPVFSTADWVQIILTFIGFAIAWYEIIRTKNSVEASRKATEQTLKVLPSYQTISDLASISSAFREIQIGLRGNRFEAASIRLQSIRSQLIRLISRGTFKDNDHKIEIQNTVVYLSKLQSTLEKKISDTNAPINISGINTKLSEFINAFSGLEEEQKYTYRSE